MLLAAAAIPATASAAACSSTASGVWTAAIWGAACPAGGPTGGDDVTINATHAITFPVGAGAYSARSLTFSAPGSSASLTHAANQTLTVGVGGVTINSSSNTNATTKAWNINTGSATVNGPVTLQQGSATNSRQARINLTTGPSPAATLTINGDLTFTSGNAVRVGIVMTGGSADGQVNLSGSFTVNTTGTLAMGTGAAIFNYNGAAAQTVRIGVSSVIYRNLHLNNTSAAGATLSAAVSATNVTGNVRVQSGILNNGGFAMVGGAGDTFEVANGARFNLSGAAAMATVFTKSFGATSTVNYQGGNQNVSVETYGHLILDGGSTKTPVAGTHIVAGDFTLGTGTTYAGNTNNPVVNLAGSFSNSGTFNSGTGQFTFNGTAAQGITGVTTFTNLTVSNTAAAVTANNAITIAGTLTLAASSLLADGGNTITANGNISNAGSHTGTGRILLAGGASAHTLSGGGSYTNLEISDAFGASLSANATVNGTLTFTSGNLNTGANTLTIGAAATISSATTSRHVVGNLEKAYSAATAFTYDVGDGTNFTPLAVTFSAAVTGNLTATVTNTDHPNTTAGTAGVDSAKSINRYWTLKNSTLSGSFSAAFNYIDGTPVDRDVGATAASFIIRRGANCSGSGGGRSCLSWGTLTLSGVPSNTLATATGISIASGDLEADFAIGELSSVKFSREKEFIYTRERY